MFLTLNHICLNTIDPPHLAWSVYACSPDHFAWERAVGRKTNVMGYPFPASTQVVSSFSFFTLPLLFASFNHLF